MTLRKYKNGVGILLVYLLAVTLPKISNAVSVEQPAMPEMPKVEVTVPSIDIFSDVEIFKTASVTEITEGGEIVYQLSVVNHGPNTAQSVLVVDQLPLSLEFVSSSSSAYDSFTGMWDIGSLTAGQSVSLSIVAKVKPSAGSTITNIADVTSTGIVDNNPANNFTRAVVMVTNEDQESEPTPTPTPISTPTPTPTPTVSSTPTPTPIEVEPTPTPTPTETMVAVVTGGGSVGGSSGGAVPAVTDSESPMPPNATGNLESDSPAGAPQILGDTANARAETPDPQPQVLGASTLPVTGLPIVDILLFAKFSSLILGLFLLWEKLLVTHTLRT